ncbi:MAG: hypothetical protein JSW45_09530 [Thiotrichales bacterium]|nr:MAG: hypothetical protein JSW45_09530 [Thiotrichales bacterium]
MFSRLLLSCMIFSVALPVFAGQPAEQASPAASPESAGTAKQPSQQQIEQQKARYERQRAKLEGKLRVEQVLLKGTGEKGVEIEISYRIVDVEGYAAHPKTTFIADEASSRLVPMTRLHKLFTPLPAEEAEKLSPASLTIWDKEGVIKPGQPVTVVVAGYGQKHLIPVAGPDYDPEAVATLSITRPNPKLVAPDAALMVSEVRVIADGHLIRVNYSSKGIKQLDASPEQTYVENPETGERHPIAKVPRIGALAPKDIEGKTGTYMVIDNAGERIKPGQKVHVVVSGVRAENVPVTGE